MHDITRSTCWNKNAYILFTKSAIECESILATCTYKLQIGYHNIIFGFLIIIITQVTKLFPNDPRSHPVLQPLTAAVVPTMAI